MKKKERRKKGKKKKKERKKVRDMMRKNQTGWDREINLHGCNES